MTVSSCSLRTTLVPGSSRSPASRRRTGDVPPAGETTMKFRAVRPAAIGKVDAVIVPLASDGTAPSGLPRGIKTIVDRLAKEEVGAGRLYGVTTHHGDPRVVVVGMGKTAELDTERARNVASAGIKSLWRANAKRVAIFVAAGALPEDRAAQAAVEGAVYAMWRPEVHRTRADEARALAKRTGVQIEVLDSDKCAALGMGSYLSVAQGSHQPPRFIVMRYRGRGGKGFDLGLVGKGITFDSGGISIKPADNMHHMKADMTGAASVIAAIGAIGKLKPKVNVIAVAPCTENLPGGAATKPGDVFTSMSGKTVEVINTDAEGRLVLIDGITYAQREGARRVVDIATLTGAVSIALGPYFTGLFGKPDAFVDVVRGVAGMAGDRVWPVPLTDEYKDEIKGEVADIRNSAGREGGAIKAAAFLWAAVEDGTEWAHLDIASVDWSDKDRADSPRGPQGPAVRTLVALAESF